jgi:lipopolysaccharide export system protein LptA
MMKMLEYRTGWMLGKLGAMLCCAFLLLPGGADLNPLQAQTASGTISGGWRMPIMENNRIRTLLTGSGAEPKGDGIYLISDVKIQLFNDQNPPQPRLTIEAPECEFESQRKVASSQGPISVSGTEEGFSITGVGFRWDQANSSLTISNKVQTLIVRRGEANNAQVRITSNRFTYDKEANEGHYVGDVTAVEGDRFHLTSDELRAVIPEDENTPQDISASGNVTIQLSVEGRSTTLRGEQADYQTSLDQGLLMLTGSPSWQSEDYSGRGEQIRIENLAASPSFTVTGQAHMELPLPGSPTTQGAVNRITLTAQSYAVTETSAVFAGSVKARSAEWALSSERLDVSLDVEQNSVSKIIAEQNVKIEQTIDGSVLSATSDHATFTPDGQSLSDARLVGNAMVTTDTLTSSAQVINLTRVADGFDVTAEDNVSVQFSRLANSNDSLFSFGAPASPQTADADSEQTVLIKATQYQITGRVGRFEGNVSVQDADGTLTCEVLDLTFGSSRNRIEKMLATGNVKVSTPQGNLSCHELEGLFAGPSNRLQKLTADNAVELKHPQGVARGAHAVFYVPGQVAELTGDPEVRTRLIREEITKNILTTADVLIWDLRTNTFKGRGHYRSRTVAAGQ